MEETAFSVLLEEYGEVLRKAVARTCPHRLGLQVAEIEQDARIRLWQALRRDREISEPASYLQRIVATATIDAVRRVKGRREQPIDDATDGASRVPSVTAGKECSPERLAMRGELVGKVRAAIAQLPRNRRRAVGLHLQGFTSQEMATLMGWTEPKARNLTYRGLKTLARQLAQEGIACETA